MAMVEEVSTATPTVSYYLPLSWPYLFGLPSYGTSSRR